MTGTIEAKYLDQAPNSYEAGLRTALLSKLKNPQIFINGLYDKKSLNMDMDWGLGIYASNIHQSFIEQVAKINKPRYFNALNLEIKNLGSKTAIDYKSDYGTTQSL